MKESFPAEDNFDLQRLPVKTLMLILQLLHREGSILLRTRAKEGGGISPQGERIYLAESVDDSTDVVLEFQKKPFWVAKPREEADPCQETIS